MDSVENRIAQSLETMLSAAITDLPIERRNSIVFTEKDTNPKVVLAVNYTREEVGHPEPEHRRNVFYTAIVVLLLRTVNISTDKEKLQNWRQQISRYMFGPSLPGVDEVDDIRFSALPPAAIPPPPAGMYIQALAYIVETYEPIGG